MVVEIARLRDLAMVDDQFEQPSHRGRRHIGCDELSRHLVVHLGVPPLLVSILLAETSIQHVLVRICLFRQLPLKRYTLFRNRDPSRNEKELLDISLWAILSSNLRVLPNPYHLLCSTFTLCHVY